MRKKIKPMNLIKLTIFFVFLFACSIAFSQDEQKDDEQINNDSYLLFEIGVVYPELEFIDSKDERSLSTDPVNISSNRLAIGRGGHLINKLGYLLTLSSNRYNVRTYYDLSNSRRFVHYNFDYAAIDGNLTLRLLDSTSTWTPYLKAGASYNYLLSGFQEMDNMTVDLKDNEDYTNDHIDFNFGFNLVRKLNQYSHFWLGYNYKLGLLEEEKVSNQKYNINANSITLGFSISTDAFKNKDNSYNRILKECNDNLDDLRAELLLLLQQDASRRDSEFKAFVNPDANGNSPLREEIKKYSKDALSNVQENMLKTVVLFRTNEANYYDIFQNDLDNLVTSLKEKPAKKINVVGYADLRGENEVNLELSKKRAIAIKNFLIDNGIDPNKIVFEFRGATTQFDNAVLMSNRRVEVLIIR